MWSRCRKSAVEVMPDKLQKFCVISLTQGGHHGSKTSSSEVFLKSVNPTLAIISCGVNNQYNLPSEKTLDMLDKLGIQYKRTDVSGTIVVGSDGEHIYVSTEK